MMMPRALPAVVVALCAAATACDDGTSSPTDEYDVFAGRWLLLTVNGENLPATNRIIGNRLMLSGMVDLPTIGGPAIWGYCFDSLSRGFGSGAEVSVYDVDPADGQAELWTFLGSLNPVADTIRLSGDTLVWEYNLRSEPGGLVTDVLRFRRLVPGEARPSCS